MKLYYHRNAGTLANTYIIVNPESKEAFIIDPGKITTKMIEHIENDKYTLQAICITQNHIHHTEGMKTLTKIYAPKIYAADSELTGSKSIVLKGDGKTHIASLPIDYISIPGYSADSMVYKIGNCLFTGDALLAGMTGKTANPYAKKLLTSNIQTKIFSQPDSVLVFPGHGPPSTIVAEKRFNMELGCPMLHTPKNLPKRF